MRAQAFFEGMASALKAVGVPPTGFGVAATFLFCLGALLAAGWLAVTVPTVAFLTHARAAQGVYAGSIAHSGGSHGGAFLYPRFTFRTQDGRTVTFTSSTGSTDQPFGDGQAVGVLYDPERPTSARRDSFFDLWFPSLFLGLFTAMPLGMAVIFLRLARRA